MRLPIGEPPSTPGEGRRFKGIYIVVSILLAGGVAYAVYKHDATKPVESDGPGEHSGHAFRVAAPNPQSRDCITRRLEGAGFGVIPGKGDVLDVILKANQAGIPSRTLHDAVEGAASTCKVQILRTYDFSAWQAEQQALPPG